MKGRHISGGSHMNNTNLLKKLKPPCSQCPYKLGQVQTVVNPCPQCRLNNYAAYERFQQMMGKKA